MFIVCCLGVAWPPLLDSVSRPVFPSQAKSQSHGGNQAGQNNQEILAHAIATHLYLVKRDQDHENHDCILRQLAQKGRVLYLDISLVSKKALTLSW